MNRSKTLCVPYILLLISAVTYPRDAFSKLQTKQAASEQGSEKEATNSKNKLRFTTGILGELIENGEKLGFTDIKASDGVNLKVMYKSFENADVASKFFNEEVTRAVRIDKRGKKKDKTGKVVGQWAQIFFVSKETKKEYPAVIWTDGSQFHMIESSSLPDILELEKVYKY